MSTSGHHQAIARNRHLSWAARGLALYLVGTGMAAGGRIDVQALIDETRAAYGRSSGRDAVYGLLKELVAVGLIERKQERDAAGRLCEVCYQLTIGAEQ
jgi:hypothetical protein